MRLERKLFKQKKNNNAQQRIVENITIYRDYYSALLQLKLKKKKEKYLMHNYDQQIQILLIQTILYKCLCMGVIDLYD